MDFEDVDATRVRTGARMLDRHLPNWHLGIHGDEIAALSGGPLDQISSKIGIESVIELAYGLAKAEGVNHDMIAPWMLANGFTASEEARPFPELIALANNLRGLWIREIEARTTSVLSA